MQKKKFKMPSAFTTLIFLTVAVAILTFIIPAGRYEYVDGIPVAGTYQRVAANPQGLWNILQAPIEGFKGATDIILFILVLGGCLGVIFETKAIDAALSRVVTKLKGREKLLIPILIIIFAIGGTTYGMAEETIAFYPIILPVLLAAGYDVFTGVLIVILGAGAGIAGGIINPFSVGIGSNLAGISLGDGLFVRTILFVLYVAFTIFYIMRYAEKVRKNPKASVVYDLPEVQKLNKRLNNEGEVLEFDGKRKKIVTIFGIMFLIMIISMIPWSYKFNIFFFQNINNYILEIPVIGKIIGNSVPFGDWYFTEMTMLFLLGAIVIGKVYRYSEKDIVKFFVAGAKDILSVALILGVAKGLSVVMSKGLIIDTILNYGETILMHIQAAIFPAIASVLYLPLSFLIPSSSGLHTATIPILAPLSDFIGIGREYVVMACQAGSAIMNLISPTQAVLIGALTLTGIPYERWLKKVLVYVLVILLITMTVLTLANIF